MIGDGREYTSFQHTHSGLYLPDQHRPKSRKRSSKAAAGWMLRHVTVVGLILGLASFAFLRYIQASFFFTLGVSPDEIGLDYVTTLSRTPAMIVALILSAGLIISVVSALTIVLILPPAKFLRWLLGRTGWPNRYRRRLVLIRHKLRARVVGLTAALILVGLGVGTLELGDLGDQFGEQLRDDCDPADNLFAESLGIRTQKVQLVARSSDVADPDRFVEPNRYVLLGIAETMPSCTTATIG